MLGDTIHAVASPPGASERAVLRLSGPEAMRAAAAVFTPALPGARGQCEGAVTVLGQPVPAMALVMPAPHSYTGEDVVELHVPGSPLLCGLVGEALQAAVPGVRPAQPGEFTRRAFEHGRIDLLQAEGVLLLIHGASEAQSRAGLAWLRGGLSAAVARARSLLQDGLALLEAGLDFTADETGSVDAGSWQEPLAAAAGELERLAAGLPAAAPGGEVLLLGAANAGKSSLANALAGRDAVLVDDRPGTTRDLLRVDVCEGVAVWDAPGDLASPTDVDRAAIELRDRLGAQAGAALLVVDPEQPVLPQLALPVLAVVATKLDRGLELPARLSVPGGVPQFAVSSRTGAGIDALRAFLVERCHAGARAAGAPVRAAITGAAALVGSVLGAAAQAPHDLHELLCADLQRALDLLATVDGSHGPEDLLDRIFGRFCVGK